MKNPILIISISSLISVSASAATLVAGWDTFNSSTNPTANQLAADTTASLATSADSGNWGQWNGGGSNSSGASTDGTFGSLTSTVAAASTFGAGEGSNSGSNLSLGRNNKPGSLVITLTNDSGAPRLLDGFYFDAVHRFGESAPDWTLSFGGAISGTSVNGVLTQSDMMGTSAANRDKFVDLTGLTDNVWEAGADAIFTLSFSGGPASSNAGTNGGNETLVDNIGITVIPEPSAFALFAFGLTGLLVRRRK